MLTDESHERTEIEKTFVEMGSAINPIFEREEKDGYKPPMV